MVFIRKNLNASVRSPWIYGTQAIKNPAEAGLGLPSTYSAAATPPFTVDPLAYVVDNAAYC